MSIDMKKALGTAAALATLLTLAPQAFAQAVDLQPQSGFGNLTKVNVASFGSIVSVVITTLLIIAVIVALVFLVWGGVKWITSNGDKARVESARSTIISALVGLIIAFLAYFLLSVVASFFGINVFALTLPTITGQ